jgi:apolipoprotein N-acyltransferase
MASERESDDTDSVPVLPDDSDEAAPVEAASPGSRLIGWFAQRRFDQRALTWLVPRLPRLCASIAAGLLMCASFPPIGWWWAAVIAIAILAVVLTRPSTTRAGGFGYGLLFGLAFYLPLLPWISGLVGAVPWIMLAAMCALFPAVFGLLAVVVRTLPGWPLWFALVWLVQEWLKSTIPFGGFPWGVVAFGQTNGPFLPLVALGGVPVVSLAVVLIGCSAAAIGLEVLAWWRRDHHADVTGRPPSVVLPGICIAVVLLAIALAFPQVRKSGAGSGDDPTVTVAAIQGNVPRLGLDFNSQRRAVLDNHVAETLRLADEVRAGRAPQPQFVIWPENSSDIDPLANPDAREEITRAAQAIGAPILVGGVVARPEWTPENPAASNTVIVWDPVTGPGERHDKQIIQPFGEYLPWRSFFTHLSSYAARAGYFVPGSGTGVVHAAGVPIGVTTCWEVIFDRAARESVLNGAQVIAVPANNATFDQPMSEQQLAIARARAVEHGRYVIVAGTTGISAVIAPDGRELARTNFFEPAFLDLQVRLKTNLTPATKWGPITQSLLVAAGIAAVIAAIMHNGRFTRPTRRRRHQPDIDRGGPTTESDAPAGGSDDDFPDEDFPGEDKEESYDHR